MIVQFHIFFIIFCKEHGTFLHAKRRYYNRELSNVAGFMSSANLKMAEYPGDSGGFLFLFASA